MKFARWLYIEFMDFGVSLCYRIGVLFGQLTGFITVSASGDDPVLRIIAHFWPRLRDY